MQGVVLEPFQAQCSNEAPPPQVLAQNPDTQLLTSRGLLGFKILICCTAPLRTNFACSAILERADAYTAIVAIRNRSRMQPSPTKPHSLACFLASLYEVTGSDGYMCLPNISFLNFNVPL